MNRLRWLVAALILVMPFLMASPVQAHALLEASLPADGASYERPPAELQLVFSENVNLDATSIQLVDSAGRSIDLEHPQSTDAISEATVLRIPLPNLGPDRYLVRWQTISSDDLHPTAGSLVFGVGTEVNPANAETTTGWDRLGSAVEAVLRWVALLALGAALAARLISERFRGSTGAPADVLPRLTPHLAAVGTLASVALGLLYLGRIASVAGLIPLATAWPFTLRWVVAWAAAATAWLILPREREPASVVSRVLSVLLLVVAVVAVTSVGHPSASGWLGGVLGALHAVSTLVWACGAAVVAVVAVPALRRHDRARANSVARAFTPLALVALPVSVITGLLLAGILLPSVGALLSTDYGHALLVKLALTVIGLACAAGTVWFLVRGRGRRRWSMVVAAEGAALCLVVLAASWTAATHPASPVVWAPSPDQGSTVGMLSTIADDLVLTLDVGPGRPGRNFITVGVLDTRRPSPAPVSTVDVAVGTDGPLSAVPQGDGQWVVATNLPNEGPASVFVTVRRAGEHAAAAPFTWVIAPDSGTRLGGAELAPVAREAALGVAGLVLLALVIGLLVRRLRRRPSRPEGMGRRAKHDIDRRYQAHRTGDR